MIKLLKIIFNTGLVEKIKDINNRTTYTQNNIHHKENEHYALFDNINNELSKGEIKETLNTYNSKDIIFSANDIIKRDKEKLSKEGIEDNNIINKFIDDIIYVIEGNSHRINSSYIMKGFDDYFNGVGINSYYDFPISKIELNIPVERSIIFKIEYMFEKKDENNIRLYNLLYKNIILRELIEKGYGINIEIKNAYTTIYASEKDFSIGLSINIYPIDRDNVSEEEYKKYNCIRFFYTEPYNNSENVYKELFIS